MRSRSAISPLKCSPSMWLKKASRWRRPGRRNASRTEQPRVLRLVPRAGEIGAEGGAADVVELDAHQRALRGRCDDGLQRRQHALAVALAERDQPHAGGNPI